MFCWDTRWVSGGGAIWHDIYNVFCTHCHRDPLWRSIWLANPSQDRRLKGLMDRGWSSHRSNGDNLLLTTVKKRSDRLGYLRPSVLPLRCLVTVCLKLCTKTDPNPKALEVIQVSSSADSLCKTGFLPHARRASIFWNLYQTLELQLIPADSRGIVNLFLDVEFYRKEQVSRSTIFLAWF